MWGPTRVDAGKVRGENISIHGPRVGADNQAINLYDTVKVFQSTAPVWGPTDTGMKYYPLVWLFQSTAPVWGPTLELYAYIDGQLFQSTAPVWGPTANVDKNAAAFLCICAIFLHF